ncbi:hypothetical protein ACXO7L_06595 [Lactobacillus delbrueckii subsp. bulgaricus]
MIKKYSKLKDYDSMGLLVQEDPNVYDQLEKEVKKDINTKEFNTLDDVLNDDSILFDGLEDLTTSDPNFFDTKKVTRKSAKYTEKAAQRKKWLTLLNIRQCFNKFSETLLVDDGRCFRSKIMRFCCIIIMS